MHIIRSLCVAASLAALAHAGSIQFVQEGWSGGGRLTVRFDGADADRDGVIQQLELSLFDAVYTPPAGSNIAWGLVDIQPDAFFFTDLDNFLIFAANPTYSVVDTAFEGEALATIFDSQLFPIDSTSAPPAAEAPEPGGLAIPGAIVLLLLAARRRMNPHRHRWILSLCAAAALSCPAAFAQRDGRTLFQQETFGGNGRTCGSCHPAANNLTIDKPFVDQLHAQNSRDPLFVNEFNTQLSQLETVDLRASGAILENVDGFEDPTNKFVSRAVNHLFSLRTSILRDPGDGTSGAIVERTGWGGDGAPGNGSLRLFLDGAIEQHFTQTLLRRVNVDFQVPNDLERDLVAAFQLNLGRLTELDLPSVRITDAQAEEGRVLFLDPRRAGRCNLCHSNAGANFIDTRLNRNFDTFTRFESGDPALHGGTVNGQFCADGGFDAVTPTPTIPGTVDGNGNPVLTMNALGNGTFSVPPLIEAADTAPFFHNNSSGPRIEDAVNFYLSNGRPPADGTVCGS